MNGFEDVASRLFRLFGTRSFRKGQLYFVYQGSEYSIVDISEKGLEYIEPPKESTFTLSRNSRYRVSEVEVRPRLVNSKIKVHIAYVPRS